MAETELRSFCFNSIYSGTVSDVNLMSVIKS